MPTEPTHRAASYRPCRLCPAPHDCDYADRATADRPCWGEVIISQEFGGECGGGLHTCEGHREVWYNVAYVPEPVAAPPAGGG